MSDFTFYEFFAGGGMARLGLGPRWRCLFANDIDPMKAATYRANFGGDHFHEGDIAQVTTAMLPGRADLAWASFPCQDLSLAGKGAGLKGERSGVFWDFWRLMQALQAEGRAPKIIALENVTGLLTSHGGRDFAALGAALAGAGYRFGAMVLDAASFVPQSRPRLFIVAFAPGVDPAPESVGAGPDPALHPKNLIGAYNGLDADAAQSWLWLHVPAPPHRNLSFNDVIEDEPTGIAWHTDAERDRLLGMMTSVNYQKVLRAQRGVRRTVGAIYKRTRLDASGAKHQRAEVRFDNLSGCLRTPGGGSSRQTIMVVQGSSVRTRLLSPREAARLMGLPEEYVLPARYNDAYHVAGDGVAVPVVRHIGEWVAEPALARAPAAAAA